MIIENESRTKRSVAVRETKGNGWMLNPWKGWEFEKIMSKINRPRNRNLTYKELKIINKGSRLAHMVSVVRKTPRLPVQPPHGPLICAFYN